jgi:outer membrane lipoprotein-sorting protein
VNRSNCTSRTLSVAAITIASSLALSACAARRLNLPTDPGVPFPDAAAVYAQLSAACSSANTLTAELGLSGHAGRQKLRGRALAGFARPDAMRLEGVAPFGAPAFILASRGRTAVLLLPRDDRVLRGAQAEEILGALTGIALAPADLLAILTGCVVPAPKPLEGRLHGDTWASIPLQGGATVYLQRVGGMWQVRAARRAGWEIEYDRWSGGFPRLVRFRSAGAPNITVDLTADINQLETNVKLDPKAFTVDVPSGASPITLDELRETGPLRGS